jgi:hypothetical protein
MEEKPLKLTKIVKTVPTSELLRETQIELVKALGVIKESLNGDPVDVTSMPVDHSIILIGSVRRVLALADAMLADCQTNLTIYQEAVMEGDKESE